MFFNGVLVCIEEVRLVVGARLICVCNTNLQIDDDIRHMDSRRKNTSNLDREDERTMGFFQTKRDRIEMKKCRKVVVHFLYIIIGGKQDFSAYTTTNTIIFGESKVV